MLSNVYFLFVPFINAVMENLGIRRLVESVEMNDNDNHRESSQTPPKTISELTSGVEKFMYTCNSSSNLRLSTFGYSGAQLSKNETLVVVYFVQHKTIRGIKGIETYGVGAKLFLRIKKMKQRISMGLPSLAASVQLGLAEVEFTFSTIGITGKKVREALPKGQEFNVENYRDVMTSIDKIIALSNDGENGVSIEPQYIPRFYENTV